ncbi:MAG: small conductance mechanosensitive channel [Methanolobus sp.]|jgi:small-conductance mechanosensitive channel|uniref:Small-conductance mechanosensitive channel n=1 Tax=Methanolobus tindarius DSM 2278 TaxID=1090322 RepID=W9DWV5_METTI|nr:mechanosensitive ion channel family protein [Methanolobus tindarius]ETA67911.1 small-conductance mechanosensitive channel [Methanolobus tindarius DSM 2278]MDI3485749.1 small conductance mechanosensitive channel [Methanolobus sp.]MDK2937974.1 small conductance mechanosensitive channel [Methanolobus sp.]
MADILSQTIPYTDITVASIVFALVVLVAGIVIAGVLSGTFRKGLKKTKLPELIIEFLVRFLRALLYVGVLLAVVSALGVNISSVVVGLSAVIGLVLGFGMQDSLNNLAAGIWIASLRPLDKGEYVTVNGMSGTVHAVGIMATELLTPDNQFITLPNKLVWGSPIVNATRMPTRRVAVDVGVGYSTDVPKAVAIAMDVIKRDSRVLADPAPAVITTELADSSVNLQLRAWVNTSDFWGVKNDLTIAIHAEFGAQDIEIPFPQLDVHMYKN